MTETTIWQGQRYGMLPEGFWDSLHDLMQRGRITSTEAKRIRKIVLGRD